MKDSKSYTHCLNCQTELQGDYCHVCGQHATNARPTVKEFFLEYLNIAFIWDTQFLKTIWQILRRPGHVTKEYISGKFVSYTHPLKLNMFLLFVFITIFLLFHKNLGNSIQNYTRDEVAYPLIQIQVLKDNAQYAERMESSAMDTVQLYAPLLLADQYPDVITAIGASDSIPMDSLFVWTAVLPHILIEDEVIISAGADHYYFSDEDKTGVIGTQFVETIWKQMVDMTTTYFPIFILLTVPFLAMLMCLTHRKGGHSSFRHFIFSLHYTAFLEMIIILLYILHLLVSPPTWVMQWIILVWACIYLALAFRRVYGTEKMFNAAVQAVLTNFGYIMVLMVLFFAIFLISCAIVIFQHAI